jgi:plastocyanin
VVTIETTDQFRFEPAVVHVHRGTVRFTLVDKGAYPHNMSFPGLHATSADVTGGLGKTQTSLTLTFASAGHYRFECTYHSTAGMTGEVVVD